MPQNTEPNHKTEYIQGHAQSLRYTLNRFMIVVSRLILAGLLLNLIIQAFTINAETGVKSIAATILPLLITGYISFSNRSASRTRTALSVPQMLNIVLYVLSGIWLIFLMLFTRYVTLYFNHSVPLGEVALSITLSVFMLVTDRMPFKSLVACAYGIISGLLTYILIFGLSL
ncbi:MAG TPA: hypothetical protein V6C57_19255 [Coleofasciculaceae cyanobacterium]